MKYDITCTFTGTAEYTDRKTDLIHLDSAELDATLDGKPLEGKHDHLWKQSLRPNTLFVVAMEALILAFEYMDQCEMDEEHQRELWEYLNKNVRENKSFQKFLDPNHVPGMAKGKVLWLDKHREKMKLN